MDTPHTNRIRRVIGHGLIGLFSGAAIGYLIILIPALLIPAFDQAALLGFFTMPMERSLAHF